MIMILILDEWTQYAIVHDWRGKPKMFHCESEALDYCKECRLYPFQLIEVTI